MTYNSFDGNFSISFNNVNENLTFLQINPIITENNLHKSDQLINGAITLTTRIHYAW